MNVDASDSFSDNPPEKSGGKPKSARHLARELAVQGLYQWRLADASLSEIYAQLSEMCASMYHDASRNFMKTLLDGVIHEADTLSQQLTPFLDRDFDKLSPIEASILLIGAFEILHCPETPARVIINEAIELGKTFGGTDGHKYINGVLDKFASQQRPEEVRQRAGYKQ